MGDDRVGLQRTIASFVSNPFGGERHREMCVCENIVIILCTGGVNFLALVAAI